MADWVMIKDEFLKEMRKMKANGKQTDVTIKKPWTAFESIVLAKSKDRDFQNPHETNIAF